MKLIRSGVLVCFLLSAGMVFPQSAPESGDSGSLFPAVVARVNGKPIAGRDLERIVRAELAPIGNPAWKNLREEYRQQLVLTSVNSLINSRLIYEKAIAAGTSVPETEVAQEMDRIAKSYGSDAQMNMALAALHRDRETLEKELRERLVIAKYLDTNIKDKVGVTPEEVEKYYNDNPDEFKHPEVVRTSQIFIEPTANTPEQDAIAKQRAEALVARIQKGEDFAKLAKENSMDSSASQGGDIGFYSRQTTTPEFWEAAYSLPVGEVKLIKTDAGYHIIKVTDKRKEGRFSLDEVKNQITLRIGTRKAEEETGKIINKLREEADIEILISAGELVNP